MPTLSKTAIDAALPGQFLWDEKLKGFGLRVAPGGTRTFLYRYRNQEGAQKYFKLGNYPKLTVDDALKALKKKVAEVARGEDPSSARKEARDAPTFGMLIDIYLGDYAQSQALRPSTVSNARTVLTKARGVLGNRKVADIGVTDVRKLHGDIRVEGIREGRKGVYQANRLLAILSKMFSLAIERGWRTDNPCAGVRKFPEDQRWHNLKDAEVGRVLSACADYEAGRRLEEANIEGQPATLSAPLPEAEWNATDREAADAVRLLLFTGARLREVLRAEWKQFDLEAGLWEKPSSHTKAKRQHRLELDGPALFLLREMNERSRHPVYLFPGNPELRRKDAPLDILTGQPKGIAPRVDLKRPWQTICELAGLEGVRIHDLRRTTASFMLSGGASLATVGKALGHTQASTTARYAHLSESVQRDGLREAGERMAALQGTVTGGSVHVLPQRTS